MIICQYCQFQGSMKMFLVTAVVLALYVNVISISFISQTYCMVRINYLYSNAGALLVTLVLSTFGRLHFVYDVGFSDVIVQSKRGRALLQ